MLKERIYDNSLVWNFFVPIAYLRLKDLLIQQERKREKGMRGVDANASKESTMNMRDDTKAGGEMFI